MTVEPDRTTAITVAEALALPALQRGLPEVLAGRDHLGRTIRWVHAGEVPNIASLLAGGELLLTTGMGVGARDAERRQFIADLTEHGVAALVIELGSTLQSIPAAMCEAAEAAHLPLIALHREVAFVRVTEAIHTELINRQYGLLRAGEEINERLIATMLDGEGLPELLGRLSAVVGNPVFLESASGRLLFHAGNDDDLEAFGGAGRGVGLEHPVPMGPGNRPGRLVVLPTRRRPTELDAIALRHAGGLVALALLRAREEDELVVRERGNLLAELADGALSGVQAAHRAQSMGFRPAAEEVRLLAVAVEESPPSPGPIRAALLADLQRELEGRATPVLCGGRSGEEPLMALAALPASTTDPERSRATTAALLADTVARVWGRRRPGTRAVVGIDGPAGWPEAGPALRVAAQTAAAARRLPDRAWHDGRDAQLERLLDAAPADQLAAFVQQTLGPLLAHDRERKLALLPTLEVLCARGGHKAQAARELHLHRQALYHRIARIESVLGADLSDPTRLITLSVALRALPYVR